MTMMMNYYADWQYKGRLKPARKPIQLPACFHVIRFDVNQFNIHEDVHDKRFIHFQLQWPWTLTFGLTITSPFAVPLSVKYELYTAFQWVNKRYVTGRLWHLTSNLLSHTRVQGHISTKFEASMTLRFRVNSSHWSDKQTDSRGATLYVDRGPHIIIV